MFIRSEQRERISAHLFPECCLFGESPHLENKAVVRWRNDHELFFSASLLSIPTPSPEIAVFRTFEYLGSTMYNQWFLGYGCIWSFVTLRGTQQRAGVKTGEGDGWDIWNGLIEKVAVHQGYYLNFGIPSASSLIHKPDLLGWKQLSKSGGLFVHHTEFVIWKLLSEVVLSVMLLKQNSTETVPKISERFKPFLQWQSEQLQD